MEHYHPSILYHAAAYKHVPMMEKHVFAAVETNIFGTWNVARAAIEYGVRRFCDDLHGQGGSADKHDGRYEACSRVGDSRPPKEGGTKFVAVRFGNVLGSNGSVVPIFKEQIAAGGPLQSLTPKCAATL